jgi:putative IMPACT (imprinted ancient) family translation regulator
MAHRSIAGPSEHVEVVKGSRFRAIVAPLAEPEAAAAWIARLREAESDAGHVAWAWRWGEASRWSDDGEPGGTAGRPMLEVILKRDLDRVIAGVARVFGGVKLGAGGLARAYGGGVAKALDAATVVDVPDRLGFSLTAPFAEVDTVLRALAEPGVLHAPPEFDAAGVVVRGTVLASEADRISLEIATATRGRAAWAWSPTAPPASPGGQRK